MMQMVEFLRLADKLESGWKNMAGKFQICLGGKI